MVISKNEMENRIADESALGAMSLDTVTERDVEHIASRIKELYAIQKTVGFSQDEKEVKQNEIDNRRRRMELAQAILDESNLCDLEKLAEIVWPDRKIERQPAGEWWCDRCKNNVLDRDWDQHRATCRGSIPDISKPTPIADPVKCQELGTHDFDFHCTWWSGGVEWGKCRRCGDERPTSSQQRENFESNPQDLG